MKRSFLSHSYKKDTSRGPKHLLCFFIILILCSACANTKVNSPTSTSIFEQPPDATAQQSPNSSQEYSAYAQQDGIMSRFDAQQTGNNPYEHTISTQNLSQLHPIWNYRAGNPLGMVSANGMIYISYAQNVDALAEKTGQVLWQYQASDDTIALGPKQSSIMVVNETVYVALSEKVCALNAQNGQLRWCAPVDATNPKEYLIDPELVYADHLLYFTAFQTLIALDVSTGKRVWSYWGATADILVANGMVYTGGVALDAHFGTLQWSFPPSTQENPSMFSSPVIANNVLYIPGQRSLFALDARTGSLLWSTELAGEPVSEPAVANGLLYLVLEVGSSVQLQALNLTTHLAGWSLPFNGQGVLASPIVANGVLYVSTIRTGGDFGYDMMWMYGIDSQTGHILRTFQDSDQIFQVRYMLVANGHLYVFGNNTPDNVTKPDVFALGLV